MSDVFLEDLACGEFVKHLEGGLWLVHWDHVAGFVNSKELKIVESLEGTSGFVADVPVSILGFREAVFAGPIDGMSPGFSTSPVADEVLVSRVDEDIKSGIEDLGDLW